VRGGNDAAMYQNALFLRKYIRETTGISLSFGNKSESEIVLSLDDNIPNAEEYRMKVKGKKLRYPVRQHQASFMVYRLYVNRFP